MSSVHTPTQLTLKLYFENFYLLHDLVDIAVNLILNMHVEKPALPSSTWLLLGVLMILTTNDMPSSQDIVPLVWMHSWVRRAALCKEKSRTLMVMWTAWWRWITIVSSKARRATYCNGSARIHNIKSALVALIAKREESGGGGGGCYGYI